MYVQIAHLSYLTDRTNIIFGVSDGLYEYGLGFLINSRSEFGGVIRGDKLDRNPVFLEKHYSMQFIRSRNTCGGAYNL